MPRAAAGGAAAMAYVTASAAKAEGVAAAAGGGVTIPTAAAYLRRWRGKRRAAAALVSPGQDAGRTQRALTSPVAAVEDRGAARVPAARGRTTQGDGDATAALSNTRQGEHEAARTASVASLHVTVAQLRAAAAGAVQWWPTPVSSHAVKCSSSHIPSWLFSTASSTRCLATVASPLSLRSATYSPISLSSSAAVSSPFSSVYFLSVSASYLYRAAIAAETSAAAPTAAIPAAAAVAASPVVVPAAAAMKPLLWPCRTTVRQRRPATLTAAVNMPAADSASEAAFQAAGTAAVPAAARAAAMAVRKKGRGGRRACPFCSVAGFIEGTEEAAPPGTAVCRAQTLPSTSPLSGFSFFSPFPLPSSSQPVVSGCVYPDSSSPSPSRFFSLPVCTLRGAPLLCFPVSSTRSFPASSSLVFALLLRRWCCALAAAPSSAAPVSAAPSSAAVASVLVSAAATASTEETRSSAAVRKEIYAPRVSISTSASLPVLYNDSSSWSPAAFRSTATKLQRQGQLLRAFLLLPYVSWRSLLRLVLLLQQHPIHIYLREPLRIAAVCKRVGIHHFCCVDPLVAAAALLPIPSPLVHSAAATAAAGPPAAPELAGAAAGGRIIAAAERASGDATGDGSWAGAYVHSPAGGLAAEIRGKKGFAVATAAKLFAGKGSLYAAASPLQQFCAQLDGWQVRGHPYHMHAVQRLLLAVALRREKYSIEQLLVLLHVLTLLQPTAEPRPLPRQLHTSLQMEQQGQQEQWRSSRKVPPVETLEEREVTVQLLLDQLLARLRLSEATNMLDSQQKAQQQRTRRLQVQEQRQQQEQHAWEQQQQQGQHASQEKQQRQFTQQRADANANLRDVTPSLADTRSEAAARAQHVQQPRFQAVHLNEFFNIVEGYEIVSRAALYTAGAAAAGPAPHLPSLSAHSSSTKGGGGMRLYGENVGVGAAVEKGGEGEGSRGYPLLSLLTTADCARSEEEAAAGCQQQHQTDVEMQLEVLQVSSVRRGRQAGAGSAFPDAAGSPALPSVATQSEARFVKDAAAAAGSGAPAAAEILAWLGRSLRRRMAATLKGDNQAEGQLLLLPASAVSSAVAATSVAATENEQESSAAGSSTRAFSDELLSSHRNWRHAQQQQQQQQQSVALALAGASSTLMRFTFVSALTQLHAVLKQSAAKPPATTAAPPAAARTSVAAAAAAQKQASCEFARREGKEEIFSNMPKLSSGERAAADAAVGVLCLCSGVAADAAPLQQQYVFAEEDQQQQRRSVGLGQHQEQLVEAEEDRKQQEPGRRLCLPEGSKDDPEGRAEAAAVATEEGGWAERIVGTSQTAVSSLLRVCALQVPEPFFPSIAQALWSAFHQSSSSSDDGRGSSGTETERNHSSCRDTDRSGRHFRGGTDRSSRDDNQSNSWNHNSSLKIATSFAPWWGQPAAAADAQDPGDAAVADATAAFPSLSSSPQDGSLSASTGLTTAASSSSSASEQELVSLLQFLPLLCRCAAAAAFRPAEAAAISPATATRRTSTVVASVVGSLVHQEQQPQEQQQPPQRQQQQDQQQRQQNEQQQEGIRGLVSLPLLPTWFFSGGGSTVHQYEGDMEKLLVLLLDARRFGKAYFALHQFIPAVKRLLLLLQRSLVLQQQQQQKISHRRQQWEEQQQQQHQGDGQQEEPQQRRQQRSGTEAGLSESCGSDSADVQAHAEAAALVYSATGAAKRLLIMEQQQLLLHDVQKKKQQNQRRLSPAVATSGARAPSAKQPHTMMQPRQSGTLATVAAAAGAAAIRWGPRRDRSNRWCWRRSGFQKRRCLLLLLQQSDLLHATAQLQMQKAVELAKAALSPLTLKRIIDESLFMNAAAPAFPAAAASSVSAVALTSARTGSRAVAPAVAHGPAVAASAALFSGFSVSGHRSSSSLPSRVATSFSSAAAVAAAADAPVPAGAVVHDWLVPYVINACALPQVAEYFGFLVKAAAAAAVHVYIATHSFRAAAAVAAAAASAGEEGTAAAGAASRAPPAAGRRRKKVEDSERFMKTQQQLQQRHAVLDEQQRGQQRFQSVWSAVRELGEHLKQRLHAIRREYEHQCRVSQQQQQLLSTLPQFQQQSRQLLLREEDLDMLRFNVLFNMSKPVATLSSSIQVRQVLQWITRETSRAAAAVQSLSCNVKPQLLLLRAAPRHGSEAAAGAAAAEVLQEEQEKEKKREEEAGREETGKSRERKGENVTTAAGNSKRSSSTTLKSYKECGEIASPPQQGHEKEAEQKNQGEEEEEEGEVEHLVLQLQHVLRLAEGVARAARYTLYTAVTQEPLQRKRWRGPCRGEVEWVQQQGIAVSAAVAEMKKKNKRKETEERTEESKEEEKDRVEGTEEKEEKGAQEANEAVEVKNSRDSTLRREKQHQQEAQMQQERLGDLVESMQPKTGAVAWDLCCPPRTCRAAARVYAPRFAPPRTTMRGYLKSLEQTRFAEA